MGPIKEHYALSILTVENAIESIDKFLNECSRKYKYEFEPSLFKPNVTYYQLPRILHVRKVIRSFRRKISKLLPKITKLIRVNVKLKSCKGPIKNL